MNLIFEPVGWSLNTNIYEVNLRQYTAEGTFNAFSKELTRLRDMGVEVLWFMPITPIGTEKKMGELGSYYACSSYTRTNPEFGSIDDFKSLVSKCHELGFRVIIDWVANHTAWDHEWTRTNPGFYKRNGQGEFYDSNGWLDVIDLNYYDQIMRREMTAAMEFWVRECDIDGFRCDMAHLVPLDFWRNARQHLDAIKPLFWLAETEDLNYRYVFDCSYAWDWMHKSEDLMLGEITVSDIRNVLRDYLAKKLPQSNYAFFTSNHDENTWNGTEFEKYREAVMCMNVFVCTWNGLTLVYSGQEMPNHKRLKFFEKDPIEWSGNYELASFYKTLLGLRSSFGNVITNILLLDTGPNSNILGFVKEGGDKQIVVLLNLSGGIQITSIENQLVSGAYRDVFSNENKEAPSLMNFTMEPWSYMVLEKM